jgi:hypothetical protein
MKEDGDIEYVESTYCNDTSLVLLILCGGWLRYRPNAGY